MQPVRPDELLEYGAIVACGRADRDACMRPVPRHFGVLVLATVAMVYCSVITGVAQSQATPWLAVTTFNGSAADANPWSVVDSYALSGATQTQLCPFPPSTTPCILNPSGYAPPRLGALAPGAADAGGALAAMQPWGVAACCATAAMAAVFWCGICRGVRMPPPGKAEGAPSTAALIGAFLALAAAQVTCGAIFVSTFDSLVYAPLLAANATLIGEGGLGDDEVVPPPPGGGPSIFVSHGGGYAVAIASIGLAAGVAVLMIVAALCAPRWFWGTRAQWYAEQLAAGKVIYPVPPGLNPCEGQALCDDNLALGGAAAFVGGAAGMQPAEYASGGSGYAAGPVYAPVPDCGYYGQPGQNYSGAPAPAAIAGVVTWGTAAPAAYYGAAPAPAPAVAYPAGYAGGSKL